MTEKRFKWDVCSYDPMFYDNGGVIDYDDVVDILNQLNDENEQLKEIIVSQRDTIKRDNKWENKTIGEINELRKENEQLKQRVNELECLLELDKLHKEVEEGKMDKFVELKWEND